MPPAAIDLLAHVAAAHTAGQFITKDDVNLIAAGLNTLMDYAKTGVGAVQGDGWLFDGARFINVADVLNVKAFGARGNSFKRTDASVAAGGTVITTAAGLNARINADDLAAGKVLVRLQKAGANPDSVGTRLTWPGWGVAPLVAKMVSHTDTTLTVDVAAGTAVAAGGSLWIGSNDGPAIRAAVAAGHCAYVPPGNYMVDPDPSSGAGGYNDGNAPSPGHQSFCISLFDPANEGTPTGAKSLRGAGRDVSRIILHGWNYGLMIMGSYCSVEDIAFEGANRVNLWSKAIDTGPGVYSSVQRCLLEQFGDLVLNLADDSAYWTFAYNRVLNNWSEGVSPVNGSDYHHIVGNHFKGNGKNGIGINGSGSIVSHNVVEHNGVRGAAPENWPSDIAGILVFQSVSGRHCDANLMTDNIVRNNIGAGIYIVADGGGNTANDNRAANNEIVGNGSGMFIEGDCARLDLSNNNVHDNLSHGIVVGGNLKDLKIHDNTVVHNGQAGQSHGQLYWNAGGVADRPSIRGNKFNDGPWVGVMYNQAGAVTNGHFEDNECVGNANGIQFFDVDGGLHARRNIGFKTETSGSASIAAGASSLTLVHGLGDGSNLVAPTRIKLTPTSDTQGLRWWISARDTYQFTITLSATATTTPVTFDWECIAGER